ncbi:SGNH/GDSL hydrolase family protein [Methylobacterium sp. WSM2598]|uniref:SGNH/GDSL hydrolase family protein n=1 Tax=Methylobacterium sp. WSM2598 TaxID=398261 RepID=UPI000687E287|nr:SGNH/GDSL hydrolase family protein [Methylobacterium sp. WSM2598]
MFRLVIAFRRAVVLPLYLFIGSISMASPAYERLVVFGDSLSDGGNAGRFSDGPVWVEYLAERLGVPLRPSKMSGLNFAIGGARLDPRSGASNLRAQVEAYLRNGGAQPATLFIVYGGANDVLAAIGSPEANEAVEVALSAMRDILEALAESGATDVLIPNLPDVSMTPAVRARSSSAAQGGAELTERFNHLLEQMLARPVGLRVHRLDVRGMAEQVRTDPRSFGFIDIATPCERRAACDGYLFWDDVHPTTRAHKSLADAAYRSISQP